MEKSDLMPGEFPRQAEQPPPAGQAAPRARADYQIGEINRGRHKGLVGHQAELVLGKFASQGERKL
jgi:hypothetical protein